MRALAEASMYSVQGSCHIGHKKNYLQKYWKLHIYETNPLNWNTLKACSQIILLLRQQQTLFCFVWRTCNVTMSLARACRKFSKGAEAEQWDRIQTFGLDFCWGMSIRSSKFPVSACVCCLAYVCHGNKTDSCWRDSPPTLARTSGQTERLRHFMGVGRSVVTRVLWFR